MGWDNIEKSGPDSAGGQFYDEHNLFYDAIIDIDSGNGVFYDGTGADGSWTYLSKS